MPKIAAANKLPKPIDVFSAMGGTSGLECGYRANNNSAFLCDHKCTATCKGNAACKSKYSTPADSASRCVGFPGLFADRQVAHTHTVVAGGLQCDSQVRKTVSLFWSFPYVCPEPVLAKCSFLYINGSKMPFFAELRPMPSEQRWLHRAGCYGDERARPLTVTDLPVTRPRVEVYYASIVSR